MKPEEYPTRKGVFVGRGVISEGELGLLARAGVQVAVILVMANTGYRRKMQYLNREQGWMEDRGIEPAWYAWIKPKEIAALAERLKVLRRDLAYRPDLMVLNLEYHEGWPSRNVDLSPIRDALPGAALGLCTHGLIDRSWAHLTAQVELGMPMSYRNDEPELDPADRDADLAEGDEPALLRHRRSWAKQAPHLPLWHCLGANDPSSTAERMTRLADSAATIGMQGACWYSAVGLRQQPARLGAVAGAFPKVAHDPPAK